LPIDTSVRFGSPGMGLGIGGLFLEPDDAPAVVHLDDAEFAGAASARS
jgi:hypothetical protein